jgi:Fe-S cluster assembly iron-binding protein IscA
MIKPDEQSVTEIETSVVTFTPVAAAKVCELLAQENDTSLGLRIFVAGGGCSGLQYGMTLDERQEDDIVDVFDRMGQPLKLDEKQKESPIDPSEGFKTFIDCMSEGFLRDSRVGYQDSLMGAGFTVDNPNAVSSCGCGHSFKTAESTSEARSCGCGH